MQDLVFLGNVNEEPYTTDKILADYCGVSVHGIKTIVYRHRDDFEEYGILSHDVTKLNGRGRPRINYRFNEQQATLLITYLDNTPQVREFKKRLVKEFFKLRSEKFKQVSNRLAGKPQRRSLTDAIKSWPYANQWSYKTFTDLLLKLVTGMNAKQLKATHQVNNALDALTPNEQAKYDAFQLVLIGLIDLGKSYQEIKAAILPLASQS